MASHYYDTDIKYGFSRNAGATSENMKYFVKFVLILVRYSYRILINFSVFMPKRNRLRFIFLMCIFSFVTCFSLSCIAKEMPKSITGEDIKQSITSYQVSVFKPINAILKVWNQDYSGSDRFEFTFYGFLSAPSNYKNFMQKIKVLDGEDEINIYDWDSPDCSLSKISLVSKDDIVYLVTSRRLSETNGDDIRPQSAPSEQLLTAYELVPAEEHQAGSKIKFRNQHFEKRFEKRTNSRVCQTVEVYELMQSFVDHNFH